MVNLITMNDVVGDEMKLGKISNKDVFKLLKQNQKIYIETGTWRGNGIKWAIENFEKVHSIELWKEYYDNCVELFKNEEKVKIHFGDSKDKLPEILSDIDEQCFIFLDAHGDIKDTGPNPLYDELKGIKTHPLNNHIILIDDLRRIGDSSDPCWSQVSVNQLKQQLKEINKNYCITEYNDMIVAALKEDFNDEIINKLKTEKKWWEN